MTRERTRFALLLVGIALLAFQLRGPLIAIAPIATEAERDLGVSSAAFGVLTTLPLICFAVTTPLATFLARRIGIEAAIEVGLVGVIVGCVVRSAGSYGAAVVGSIVLGTAITIGNVLVPAIVNRDVPARRRAGVTGFYTVTLAVGTMIPGLLTVPLAGVIGWPAAIASYSLAGLVAAAVWLALLRTRRGRVAAAARLQPPAQPVPIPGRFRPSARSWLLAATFGAQAFSFYGIAAWLPTLLVDTTGADAASAGVASGLFQLTGVIGGIGIPLLAYRLSPGGLLAVVGTLWVTLAVGLLLVPQWFPVLAVIGGAAHGGGFTAIFTAISRGEGGVRATASVSAFVQSVGYLIASVAPPLVGALYRASGGWTAPLLVILGTTSAFLVCGVAAARLDRRTAGMRR